MTIPIAQTYLDAIIDAATQAKRELLPDAPAPSTVKAGQSLQAAIDASGGVLVQTEPGAVFDAVTLPSKTRLTFGAGSGVTTTVSGLPAVRVLAGTSDVIVTGGVFRAVADDVVAIGTNTSAQTTLDSAPRMVTLNGLLVPTHRGRRAFALHGRDITLTGCYGLDVIATSGQDSQGVYILNGPGPYTVDGGRFEAASENILVGGDRPQIVGLVPADITIRNTQLTKRESWRGGGKSVKNLFELKTGRRVLFEKNTLWNCWADGQSGYAFTITPALDGVKRTPVPPSGSIQDVTIRQNVVWDVGAIFNLLGRQYEGAWTELPLDNLQITDNLFACDRVRNNGNGQFITAGGEVGRLTADRNVVLVDGSSLVYGYRGTVMQVDGTKRAGGNFAGMAFHANVANMGKYGFNLDGVINSHLTQHLVTDLAIDGNTFNGGVAIPGNATLAALTFEALPEVVAARDRLKAEATTVVNSFA